MKTIRALLFLVFSAALFACSTTTTSSTPHARAVIEPKNGATVNGYVDFTPVASGGLSVRVELTGLQPNTTHGFHLHETGDCSAADASSAGGHFNPTGMTHGGAQTSTSHAGDLGNVLTNLMGEIHETLPAPQLTFDSGAAAVIGRAIVIHADRDDLQSQPAGNSGKRIGCGVVTLATSVQ